MEPQAVTGPGLDLPHGGSRPRPEQGRTRGEGGGQDNLVALRALRGPQRLVGLCPTAPGIVWLRRSAALLVASSSMIGASIEGLPIDGVGECLRVCGTSQQSAVISMVDTLGGVRLRVLRNRLTRSGPVYRVILGWCPKRGRGFWPIPPKRRA